MPTHQIQTGPQSRFPWLHAIPVALVFLLVELMKALRSSFWAGFNGSEWAAIGIGFLAYLLFIVVGTTVLDRLARRVWRASNRQPGYPAFVWIAGCALWALMAICRPEGVARTDVAICAALLAFGILNYAGARRQLIRPEMTNTIVAIAAIAGSSVMLAGGLALTYQIARRLVWVTVAPLMWGACTALVLVVVFGVFRRVAARRWATAVVVVISLVLPWLVIPPAFRAAPSENPSRPNLLFITSDALRADYCSVYGGKVPTPSLERLGEAGVRFLHAYSLAPWTVPSMNGVFSSSYPAGLTVGADRATWRRDVTLYHFQSRDPTLAERLQANGYETAAFVGNPLLGDPKGILRGMRYTVSFPAHAPVYRGCLRGLPALRQALSRFIPQLALLRQADTVRTQTDQALTFLNQHRQTPFFLWLHLIDPHTPYDPPDKYRTMHGPWRVFSPQAPYWPSPQQQDDGSVAVPEKDIAYVRHLYEGEIRHVDDEIGRILDALNRMGLSGKTMVCFSADHGEEFWDHGGYGHGQSVYNELVHVPLLMRGPGVPSGVNVQASVSGLDVMPTFAEMLALNPGMHWKGTSLVPLFTDVTVSGSPVFARATNRYAWPDTFEMVVRGHEKLVYNSRDESYTLYDLDRDPGETNDLSTTQPDVASRYLEILKAWRTPLPASIADGVESGAGPDAHMEEMLRSLGYLQ